MKTSYCSLALLLACWLFAAANLIAQSTNFQHLYGTGANNSFTKTLRSGTSYYVLGRDGTLNRATVTRLDAQGQHQWTRRLDIASQWNDAIVTPNGNLLLVGNTLPFDANCQSLAAVVTAAGAFSWVRSYNVPGRETFNRVVRNPSPNNGTFPYYILGTQWDPAGNANWDDVVLLTVSEAGNFGWKKRYTGVFGSTDDEFARDLEALPNGDLLLAGNLGTSGVVFRADNTGALYNAAGPGGLSFSFADVARASDGFWAVGNTFPSVSAYLMKFDNDLLVQWQINLPDLTAVSQVWRDDDDGIYVTGRATVDGINRGVLLKFQDFGNDPAPLLWMKYLDNEEVAYTGGSSWYLPPGQLAFTDGRNTSELRAFMSVSDLEMSTCMTREGFVSTVSADLLFNSLVPPDIEFVDIPVGTNVTQSSTVNWQQDDACPAIGSISGRAYRECGDLPYTDQAVLPGWTVQLLDASGNLIAEQQTDSVGGYGFYNLPQGLYTCRIVPQPGWTPSVPASGEYLVDSRNTSEMRNFGWCPSCSCDDIYFDVVQLPGTSDTCEFGLAVTNAGAYCFDEINLALSAGAFESVAPASGWEVTVIDSQHLRLTPTGGDWTTFVFHKGRLRNVSMSEMTVSTSYHVGQGTVVCERVFGLVCPPPVITRSCCPSGTTPGPELVQNGDFELGNQDFTNSYIYLPPGNSMPSGRYSVLNASEVYTANNQWACTDHTAASPTGRMLVVDGYGGPIAWQQTVNVTAGVKYIFAAWFNNLVRPPKDFADPQMALFVDNTQIAGPLTLPETPDRWVLLCDTFYATVTGAVTLSIRMLSTASIGNDVAIDDVSFRACAPLPDCVCPPNAFTNMSYKQSSGPNVPIACGDIAIWLCQFPVFNLGGDFMCQGNNCLSTPGMFWTLTHPTLGQVDNGVMNGTGFQVSIPNASFPAPGLYTLTLAGICGNDTCYCEILIETPGCACSADFSAQIVECGKVNFTSHAGGAAPFAYCWDFDGNPATCESTQQNPMWQYPACGTYNVCLTVTDANNCTATSCQTVSITDNIPPVAVCNLGVGVDLDPITCMFNVTPAFVDGGSSDNCQIQNMTVSPSVLTGCADHTVTLTVTDWCGNTSTCTMGIQTLEVVPPTINCPANLTVHGFVDAAGVCQNVVNGIAPQASDNCGLLGVAYSLNAGNVILLPDASGITFSQGTTTVTYFAADVCLNTASCSFTVTIDCECDCPTAGGFDDELLMNGDFSGTGGFVTDYVSNCTSQSEGQYCITSDAANVSLGFSKCTDMTGSGNIFVANGSGNAGIDVLRYPTITVVPGRNYIFSFYHASVTGANPAQFEVYFNGTKVGPVAPASPDVCDWRRHCVRWNSGNATSVIISIRNQNPIALGNDFAIDKVSFRECKKCAPLPNNAVLWMPMDEDFGDNTINSTINGLVAIPSGAIGSGGPNPVQGKVDASNSGNGALSFVGPPASPVSVSNDPKLNFGNGSFTIDAWVKTNLTTQSAPVVVKQNNQGGYAFGITGTPVTGFPFLSLGTPNGPPLYFQGIHPVTLGQWNFVAVTIQPPVGANPGTVTFYTGGDPGGGSAYNTSAHTFSGATNASTNGPLYIGYNPQNPHIDIAIDELEMFDTALAPAEIKRIWEADSEGKCRSTCACGGFSKLAIRNKKGGLNKFLSCGNQPESLPCVPGQGYHLTGVFHCDGGECVPEHEIRWTLSGPGGTQSGSFIDNDPFFGIHLLPNWFGTSGTYTLTLSGDCGAEACTCVVKFDVNCPNLCPCDQSDRDVFQQNAAKGFATAVSLKTCKACFSPLALSDCESVDWWLNGIGGTYLGSTVGKQTLCYAFPQPGMYTIVMDVVRTMPDGSLCDLYTYTQTVTLSCTDVTECPGSVLPNANFSTDPMPGDLGDLGMAPGWNKVEHSGDPHEAILLEYGNSQDGWVMALTGSYSGAGVLSSAEPLCVSKSDTGILTMTLRTLGDPIPGAMIKVGRKPPGGGNNIFLYTGDTAPWPNCPDARCYSLAVLEDLLPFDDDDWYELRIPYNLSDWAALDSCGDFAGGIPARMVVFVSNYLSEEQQSAGPVRDAILIDNICFRGMTVSAKELALSKGLRLYPNPTPGHFTLELPAPAPSGTTIRITDPTGRLALEATAEVGSERQQVQTGALPAGLYFVQVLQSGRVVGVSRFVKQ